MTYDSEGIYFTFHNITDCRSFFTLTFPTCFQIVTDCLEEIFFWIRFLRNENVWNISDGLYLTEKHKFNVPKFTSKLGFKIWEYTNLRYWL